MRAKMQDPRSYLSPGRFTLVEGDLNEMLFPEKFDIIITVGVLEHVVNLTGTLQRFASFLVPDGKALIHMITGHLE
jgi:cyclopropane-fatty-acyl-phospholipid synthase